MSRRVTFLTAKQPLTKTFYSSGDVEPYPLTKEFTSMVIGYTTIEELYETFKLSGSIGATMLKGHLTKQIEHESRAGLTDPNAETDLLVLDYDSDGGFESINELLYEIDPLLQSTDYIFQHSASSGVNGKSGLRGHVFIMLDSPVSPNILKQWLKKINLSSKKFKDRIKLSRNAMALCYALDISVVQNDKLIYIANPIFIGMDDPVKNRFELHKNEHRTFKFTAIVSTDSNKTKELKVLSDLRNRNGLEIRTPKYKSVGEHEILLNPGVCIISGTKDCGDYVRLNLNGGDSFAYWYHKNNPELLHNFKGEPPVFLRDIAPDYYERLQQQTRSDAIRPFVFRDWVTDTYYNAEYNESNGKLVGCYAARRTGLSDFMLGRGKPAPRIIEDWNVFFDPTKNDVVDFKHKTLNLFTATDYLKDTTANPDAKFPIIERVLRHICVEDAVYRHFIQWLAHIVKHRTKTQTAWLFSGTEGTGKGTLFHRILKPIFGSEQVFLITQDQADEQFNGYLRQNMILFMDEGDIESSKQAERMMAKFRSIITEPTVPLRVMRSNTVSVDSFTNVIIATNKSLPIKLTQGDRRYNVAPRQNKKLDINVEEYDLISSELKDFTSYLMAQDVQLGDSIKIVQTKARDDLIDLSKTVADDFFEAFLAGDLDFFAELLFETVPLNNPSYINYSKHITNWMRNTGVQLEIETSTLLEVYKHVSGNNDMTEKRFGHLLKRKEIEPARKRVKGVLRRIVPITFLKKDYTDWLDRDVKSAIENFNADIIGGKDGLQKTGKNTTETKKIN